MRILITAGPTREFIDRVRFISNPSSGKMGYLCAQASVARDHKTILISGPSTLPAPRGATFIKVTSAKEMYQQTLKNFNKCNAVISAAAVCDYMPLKRFSTKLKKEKTKYLVLKLTRTPDILETIGKLKKRQILVGFALETKKDKKSAIQKLKRKNLDMIVLNTTETFEKDHIEPIIIFKDGRQIIPGRLTKKKLALTLIKLIENMHLNEHT